MKNHISFLLRLAIATLIVFPALALAVPTTSPYNTDVTNSYVQDQTSQVMGRLNSILCYMGAMAPNLMVNEGNYIALVDENTCDSGGGSGGKSNNTGPAYSSVVVNSARASNTDPMLVKVWLAPQSGVDMKVYATASQAPSATLPYGVFRMDYCGTVTSGVACAADMGYINATSDGGLSFYSASTFSAASEVTALQLDATSTSAGSGAVEHTNSWTAGTTTFAFAYDADYFIRDNGTDTQCFNRDPLQADESVWRYGLYDATTGEQVTRNSGFPIEYTDTGTSTTYSGYIGYYGLWMPVTVPSGATVEQISYDTDPPTKTSYTLLETGGKLTRYTTGTKTLAALNKITFWYFAQYTLPATGTPVMDAGSQYELYWDDAAQQFVVSGKQGSAPNYNMESYTTPVAVTNADMVTANPWGLSGWSEMAGGQFGISGDDFAALTTPTTAIPTPSDIPVLTQTANIVYPDEFATIGSLTCINDCPTGTSTLNQGWTPVASDVFVTYTLDSASGNMIYAASSVPAVSTTNEVISGRLVTAQGATDMMAAKYTSGVCGITTSGNCPSFNQGDVDFLPAPSSYYIWETGANSWNKIALLMNSGGSAVAFDPPLQVSFVVPANTDLVNKTPYGNYAGATLSLQYGGFGDLWGIPNECIDVTTNGACDFAPGGTAQNNQRWTSKFSIPFDTTTGVVTTTTASYLVKPLDKEVRLKEVVSCAGVSLSVPASGSVTLPAAGDFSNPTTTVGAEPTFTTVPAPQVIHGVKQY